MVLPDGAVCECVWVFLFTTENARWHEPIVDMCIDICIDMC